MYDHELDSFKRDIHLVQFALERYGYVRDRRESSRACHVLRHEASDDKLVVRRDADGHWTYFSVRDGRDNGTVIDFVQARGGRGLREVREELRRYLGRPHPPFDPPQAPLLAAAREPRAVGVGEAFAEGLRADNSPYLNARGLRPETLRDSRFAETWRLGPRQNVLFVHTDDAGVVTGFEVKNHGFTGFATGGRKTAWQSTARPDDRALVITESAIDALSHHQLHPEQRSHTRYLSTAGQPSTSQMELLDRVLSRLPPACTVLAAVDADVAGHALASRIEALVRGRAELTFRRDAPAGGKDYLPRAPGEPEAQALARLRHCIDRSTDKGSIVEFVRERDSAARPGEVSLERVRERLRAFHATGLGLDVDGALRPPPYGRGRERPTDPTRDGPQAGGRPDPELHRRRYDWTPPPPGGPRETQVEQRLRRWREAQATIEAKLQRRSESPGREPPAPAVAPQAEVNAPKSELHRRRYDWTPQPAGIEALRGARSRAPGRDR